MKQVDESVPLTKENLDKILEYLPYFQNRSNNFYEFIDSNKNPNELFQFPYYKYSDKVIEFEKELYNQNFITNFRWTKGARKAAKYSLDKKSLYKVNLEEIRKLLTTILKQNEVVEGLLAEVIETGFMCRILERIKEIREEL